MEAIRQENNRRALTRFILPTLNNEEGSIRRRDYCMPESTKTASLAFARKEKSSSDSEQSDKGECVELLFE